MAKFANNVIETSLFISLLIILQVHEFQQVVYAARPPPLPIMNMQNPPLVNHMIIKRLHHPNAAAYRINRYKKTETEAFRPTIIGRSPGAGHGGPPGSR